MTNELAKGLVTIRGGHGGLPLSRVGQIVGVREVEAALLDQGRELLDQSRVSLALPGCQIVAGSRQTKILASSSVSENSGPPIGTIATLPSAKMSCLSCQRGVSLVAPVMAMR